MVHLTGSEQAHVLGVKDLGEGHRRNPIEQKDGESVDRKLRVLSGWSRRAETPKQGEKCKAERFDPQGAGTGPAYSVEEDNHIGSKDMQECDRELAYHH